MGGIHSILNRIGNLHEHRDILRLFWQQTENYKGIFDGQQSHASFPSSVIHDLQVM